MANMKNPLYDMILIALENKNNTLKKIMKQSRFVEEHCTVTFGLPRKNGNSAMIKDCVKRLVGYKCIVLYHSKDSMHVHEGSHTVRSYCDKPEKCDIIFVDCFRTGVIIKDIIDLRRTFDEMKINNKFLFVPVN
jgi:hypothetical protein